MNFEPSISFSRLTDKNIIYAIEFNNRKVPSCLLGRSFISLFPLQCEPSERC